MPAKKVTEPETPPTMEELLKRVEELEKRTQDAEQRADRKDEEIRALKAQEEGWLITTPNSTYDGVVMGVEFKSGMAFVAKARYFKDYDFPKLDKVSEHKIRNEQYKGFPDEWIDEHIANIRAREQLTTSERVIEQLETDWGYHVEWFGVDRLDEIPKRVSERQIERAKMEELLSRHDNTEKLMMPHYMNK